LSIPKPEKAGGIAFELNYSVFHWILDFIKGLNFYSGPFFIGSPKALVQAGYLASSALPASRHGLCF
jgi:hypothetical protein